MTGAKLLVRMNTKYIRWIFAIVISILSVQMMMKGIQGKF